MAAHPMSSPADESSIPKPQAWYAAAKLAERFPTVPTQEIARVLIDARRGVDLFGLAPEQERAIAEKIAIEQLNQLTGQSTALATARLDPERHARRVRKPVADSATQ